MIKSQITMEEALHRKQCPLCRTVRESEERLVWFLLYESTGDRQLRTEWDKGKGFCKYHSSLLRMSVTQGRLVSGSSIARIYETILDSYLEDSKGLINSFHTRDLAKCFFCHRREELENNSITSFISFLRGDKGRQVYENSDGLCNPHLVNVLSHTDDISDKSLRPFLIKVHINALEKLKNNLMELQRKEKYDVKQPTTAEEKNSWAEVLWRFGMVNYDNLLIWSD